MMGSSGQLERDILERSYQDRADVFQHETAKDPVTKQMISSWTQVAQGFRCGLSKDRSGSHTVSEGIGTTSSSYTLFCSPNAVISAGNRVVVHTSFGRQFDLIAGQPFEYPSHLEIPMREEKRA